MTENFTNELKTLKESMRKANSSFENIKTMIKQQLEGVEDSVGITRISKNIFTISFSKLDASILSPKHYDISYQVEAILNVLNNTETILQLQRKVNNFIETKKIVNSKENFVINSALLTVLEEISKSLTILEE